MQLQKNILGFIKKHHLLALSTIHENSPYSCSCFYAFNNNDYEFVILSELNTKHAQQALINDNVSGIIALETNLIGKIQGIQFTGKIYRIGESEISVYKNIYLKRFPFAIFADGDIWKIVPEYIKFTDNTLGFGKKIIWNRS